MNKKTKKFFGIIAGIVFLVVLIGHRIAWGFFTGYIEIILFTLLLIIFSVMKLWLPDNESDDSKK